MLKRRVPVLQVWIPMHGLHGLTASSRLPAANCCSTASTATQPVLTMASSTQKTRYVGEQGVQLAGAYYEADFDFEEHARAVAPLLERRLEEARRLCSTSATAKAAQMAEGGKWESFYQTHEEAKFYKLRRYILLQFPQLLTPNAHVAEIGCGCGSSILPVLQANNTSTATVTDVSSTCIQQLRDAAAAMGIDEARRISSFVCDSTDPDEAARFEGVGADLLLIMFTLSAVTIAQQHEMLRNAYRALKPGGRVLLRDHGVYDMVQLRIPPEQWMGVPHLYQRGDGTFSYFFSVEELGRRAREAGLEVEEAKYICVHNTNRKKGLQLKRVFVHGVFRRPLQ